MPLQCRDLSPPAASQMRAVVSSEAVTTRVPSGLKAARFTAPRALQDHDLMPVGASQMRAVASSEAVTTRVPSGLKAAVSRPLVSLQDRDRRPRRRSRSAAVLSAGRRHYAPAIGAEGGGSYAVVMAVQSRSALRSRRPDPRGIIFGGGNHCAPSGLKAAKSPRCHAR